MFLVLEVTALSCVYVFVNESWYRRLSLLSVEMDEVCLLVAPNKQYWVSEICLLAVYILSSWDPVLSFTCKVLSRNVGQ